MCRVNLLILSTYQNFYFTNEDGLNQSNDENELNQLNEGDDLDQYVDGDVESSDTSNCFYLISSTNSAGALWISVTAQFLKPKK